MHCFYDLHRTNTIYSIYLYTYFISHATQKIVINTLMLKVDFSWHSVWCWETWISPKLLAKNMQNNGWPYKSFADYAGHLILVPKWSTCCWAVEFEVYICTIQPWFYMNLTISCLKMWPIIQTLTCDILLLSFITYNLKKFICYAFHVIQRETNLH
jgi:hypothetical protein